MLLRNLAVLALSFTLTSPIFAGSESGGGSDPLEIVAQPYQNKDQLSAALRLVQEKVEASSLRDADKDAFLSDLNYLAANNKFKTLPAMIIMGAGKQDGGYDLPADADKFISLGGMTKFEERATVYFAERVKEYSVEKLAHLVIHEVFHHILPRGFKNDEKFVELITTAVDSGIDDERIEKAFHVHGFYSEDYISRESFIKAYLDPSIHGHEVPRSKLMAVRLPYHLPSDLSKLTVEQTVSAIFQAMVKTGSNTHNLGSSSLVQNTDQYRIRVRIQNIVTMVDPQRSINLSGVLKCGFFSCTVDGTKLSEVLSIK